MTTIRGFFKENKSFLIILVVMLTYFIRHLISFRLGMNYEESRDANAYLLAMQGYLPYRDFEWIYGPFAFFIYPFIMKIFGINLIVLRVSYIIFGSLIIPLTFFLAKRIMPRFWAGIAAFLSIVFFDVPYYTFNHVFAVLGELASLLMICRFVETDKKISNLLWAGVFATVTILTKHFSDGVSLCFAVSLFLLFVAPDPLRKKLKNYSIFVIVIAFLVLTYFLYFYSQAKLKNIDVTHPYFAKGSLLLIDQTAKINLGRIILSFFKGFTGILPIGKMIKISSIAEIKEVLVFSFNNFIFTLPIIAPIVILLIHIISKFKKERQNPEVKYKQEIYLDKKFLLLFAIFSIFISLESFMNSQQFRRAYIIQIPSILTVYILYLLKRDCSRRQAITIPFIMLFLLYISFLHFFRYPYSMLKKYTEPLQLERAKGVLVTYNEKELYESLSSYLSGSINQGDRIGIMGYFPQLSFLTKRKNIFECDEYIFRKLETLRDLVIKRKEMRSVIASFEDWIISKIEKENPKVILTITGSSLIDFESLHPRVITYIKKEYSLDKAFGPADLFGLGGSEGWVELYKYKRQKR